MNHPKEIQVNPERLIGVMQAQKANLEHRNTVLECALAEAYEEIDNLRKTVDDLAVKEDGDGEERIQKRSAVDHQGFDC